MRQSECPICHNIAKITASSGTEMLELSECRCKNYRISSDAYADKEFNSIFRNDKERKLFSGYINNNKLVITNKFIHEKLREIIDYCNSITLAEKIEMIKSYIYEKTLSLGKNIYIPFESYTSFYLLDQGELEKILEYLNHSGFIDIAGGRRPLEVPMLSVNGFNEMEYSAPHSNLVFIACKFGTDYQTELIETIRKACGTFGYQANTVNQTPHNDNISNRILADIKKSKFVVAEFTEKNNGVYFEAGYAMGLNKPVIKLIKLGHIKELHFDTKQFNHIEWDQGNLDKLKEDLIANIEVNIQNNN